MLKLNQVARKKVSTTLFLEYHNIHSRIDAFIHLKNRNIFWEKCIICLKQTNKQKRLENKTEFMQGRQIYVVCRNHNTGFNFPKVSKR